MKSQTVYKNELEHFLALIYSWNYLGGKSVTENTLKRAKGIVSSAKNLMEQHSHLRRIKFHANEYDGLSVRFPTHCVGGIDPYAPFPAQYMGCFEDWQFEMSTEQDRRALVTIHENANALIELAPIEIGKIELPVEPLYNAYKYVSFPKPRKVPEKFKIKK